MHMLFVLLRNELIRRFVFRGFLDRLLGVLSPGTPEAGGRRTISPNIFFVCIFMHSIYTYYHGAKETTPRLSFCLRPIKRRKVGVFVR